MKARQMLEKAGLAASFIVAVLLCLTLSLHHLNSRAPIKDELQNTVAAYHLATTGVFSEDMTDSDAPTPSYFREPLYPYMMALMLKAFPDRDLASYRIACLTDPSPDRCPRVRKLLKAPNIIFNTLLIAALGAATWSMAGSAQWSGGVMLFMGVNTVFTVFANGYYSEPLAALLLFGQAFGLYRALHIAERHRYAWCVVSGLSFGLLVLVKAAFWYVLPVMLMVGLGAACVPAVRQQPRLLTAFLLSLGVAFCIVAPWIARNHALGAGWTISDRGPEILSIRASYDTMPWADVPRAAVQFTPIISSKIKRAVMGQDAYHRFARKSPDSYYRLAKDRKAAPNVLAAQEGISLKKASMQVIRANILKHIALTPIFAYDQSFPPATTGRKSSALGTINAVIGLAYVPFFMLFVISAVRRRRVDYLAMALTVILPFGMYAFLTHAIPRYGVPYVPVYVLAAVMYLSERHKRNAALSIEP